MIICLMSTCHSCVIILLFRTLLREYSELGSQDLCIRYTILSSTGYSCAKSCTSHECTKDTGMFNVKQIYTSQMATTVGVYCNPLSQV